MKKPQTILITGATAGIGRFVALDLARRGHHVIATGRSRAALAALGDEARKASLKGKLDTAELDVTSEVSLAMALRQVESLTAGYGVDVLVNNAGYGNAVPLLETSTDDLRAQYETNVFGLMAVTRAFLPPMQERGRGRVINVSSVGGRITLPFFGAYNSSKFAVESLSDALRMEVAPLGIQVAIVEPGPIRSEFSRKSVEWANAHKGASSPYAGLYERAEKMRTQVDAASAGPESVARAIAHAIEARRARVRYVVPFSSQMFVWVGRALPTRWIDWGLRLYAGLTRKGMSQTAAPRPSVPTRKPASVQDVSVS